MWLGFVGPTATAMLPKSPDGNPSLSRSHVKPPSLDRYRPLPAPPDTSSQGRRTNCHIPANNMRGLPGTITRSAAPVESFTNSTFCHVLPPSAVRNTPRSALGAHTWPWAATKTTSGLAGSITIRETWPTSLRPMNCQLLPASGDMKTPRPSTTSLRGFPSPVPTHTTFGLEGASATAPIDAVG